MSGGGFSEMVDYAEAVGVLRPADTEREGFGWRIITDLEFWDHWKRSKEAMKSAGYRVTKSDAGQWLVSFHPSENRHRYEDAAVVAHVKEWLAKSKEWV